MDRPAPYDNANCMFARKYEQNGAASVLHQSAAGFASAQGYTAPKKRWKTPRYVTIALTVGVLLMLSRTGTSTANVIRTNDSSANAHLQGNTHLQGTQQYNTINTHAMSEKQGYACEGASHRLPTHAQSHAHSLLAQKLDSQPTHDSPKHHNTTRSPVNTTIEPTNPTSTPRHQARTQVTQHRLCTRFSLTTNTRGPGSASGMELTEINPGTQCTTQYRGRRRRQHR